MIEDGNAVVLEQDAAELEDLAECEGQRRALAELGLVAPTRCQVAMVFLAVERGRLVSPAEREGEAAAGVCAVLARGPPDPIRSGHSRREPRIQANSPPVNEVRRIGPPRRPFLVALAATVLLGAVEYTPSGALETPSLSAVIAAGVRVPGAPTAAPIWFPVDSAVLEREVVSRYNYRPLARLLGRHNRNPEMVRRIARAIVKEAGRLQVAPSLLTGVLLTENPRLETGTVSSQGAIGLMQVMHFHAGEFDCESDDLRDVESNICHGAGVFGQYLKRTGNVKRALLRYNGCVVSANTPNCHRYPAKVIRTAGQVRRDLLAYPAKAGGQAGRRAGGQAVGRLGGQLE